MPKGIVYGGLARACALVAGVTEWWNVTEWEYDLDEVE